jgi:CRISPR-associated protein Csm5
MKQLGHLKTYKIKLTTLSPIFIGGGEFSDLSQLQYVLTGNKLKIVDETKFMKFLKQSNHLDKFINYVSKPQYNKNGKLISPTLTYWINQNFSNREIDIYSKIENIGEIAKRNLNYVRSFIKNNEEKPYIPGSSIKGAIRTALLSYLIDLGKTKSESEEILKKQMNYIQLTDSKSLDTKNLMYRQTQHQQLISDSHSAKRNGDLRIDYKLMNVDNDLKEILREGIVCTFNITLEDNFIYTIEELLKIINGFYTNVYNENKELNKIAQDLKTNILVKDCIPNINIGGQSGFNTKVVLRALARDENEYMQYKKEKLSNAYKKHSHLNARVAPRCLRVVERYKENDKTLMPMGWCNISLVD